ncbi:restriction endonuclease [Acidithiobacillus caldus]
MDLSRLADREALMVAMQQRYPGAKRKKILNWTSQVWPFAKDIQVGDLVVLPSKSQPVIYIGEVSGGYNYDATAASPFYHWRPVSWIGDAIPRSHFGRDLLYSFGAFLTICRIQRNHAEERIAAIRASGWQAETLASAIGKSKAIATDEEASEAEETDLEELAQDQISRLIAARFKGHGLTRLIDAILRAQGYTTLISPEGADGGVDILAGTGMLGFGEPRLCVEVKSEDSPIDRPTVDKLIGAVSKFGATQGLFVAWGGFKSTVQRELAASFFRVRLWTQKEVMAQLFAHYDQLDEDIRAELPMKRIWIVVGQEE